MQAYNVLHYLALAFSYITFLLHCFLCEKALTQALSPLLCICVLGFFVVVVTRARKQAS